ncbi:helix-turn-helix transcriptional regulator [Oscillatoria sp. FACHB-1406]|uniref:helix-turn-helix domain-containing protein n=1 Tax=Oscillatoria sp. FACHB-1406 TaxID=2692846 RepID=UPI00168A10FF|nr:helix-turn-helix transcriptional regulator [Oscillatoria sp. FACHB-1406]MBD2579009.1 helix-turn-helix transcriptional regulator [Oscillatoria sp. FACHB-1406]
MGKAGHALKKTLEAYKISQRHLATVLGVRSYVVYRWFHEQIDPSAENTAAIASALQQIDPDAANAFVRLYLGEYLEEKPVQAGKEEE